MDEINIIKKLQEEMGRIFNLLPGETFSMDGCDSLLIIQRKLEDCDLKNLLGDFNQVFAKTDGMTNEEIACSAVAYMQIKALAERDLVNFDPESKRELIKEYKSQTVKISNIVRLSNLNALTADVYQKEKIDRTLNKNEVLLEYFEREIKRLEKEIERLPEPEKAEKIPEKKQEVKASRKDGTKRNLIQVKIQKLKNKRNAGKFLVQEEKNASRTLCREIPFYDPVLFYTEIYECKDLSEFVILKRRNNVYFGMKKNIWKNTYVNKEETLFELTEATDEFIQFMTSDLLTGEYLLEPFSERDKVSLQMYFDFMLWCFERYIGMTVSVQEYIKFKDYYNRLVLMMIALEEKQMKAYYRALGITDKYITYMSVYNLSISDNKNDIISNLLNSQGTGYADDLAMIIENHVVDETAKNELMKLSDSIKNFGKKEDMENE